MATRTYIPRDERPLTFGQIISKDEREDIDRYLVRIAFRTSLLATMIQQLPDFFDARFDA